MKSSIARLVITGIIVTTACMFSGRGNVQHYPGGFKLSWSSHDLEQLGAHPRAGFSMEKRIR